MESLAPRRGAIESGCNLLPVEFGGVELLREQLGTLLRFGGIRQQFPELPLGLFNRGLQLVGLQVGVARAKPLEWRRKETRRLPTVYTRETAAKCIAGIGQ